MKKTLFVILFSALFVTCFPQKYQNFKVSVYCTAQDVSQMADTTNYLKPMWDEITRQLKIDKVYIETHRDYFIVDQKTLDIAKKFFNDRGIETAGGITFTATPTGHFQSFCYNDPGDRKRQKKLLNTQLRILMRSSLMIFSLQTAKPTVLLRIKATEAGPNIVWT